MVFSICIAEFVTDHTCDKQVIAILIFGIVWRVRDWCKIKLCIVWLVLEITIRLCVVWLVLDIDDDDDECTSRRQVGDDAEASPTD